MSDRCPSCGASSAIGEEGRSHEQGGVRYTLMRCGACTMIFWTPLRMPDRHYYESLELDLDSSYYETMHTEGYGELPIHQKPFFRHCRLRQGQLLDLGCGDGTFLRFARAAGFDPVGVDFDAASVESAQRQGLEAVSSSFDEYFQEARQAGMRFDVVTMFEVLEHQCDPVGLLRGAFELLGSDGLLAGTVPNRVRFKPFGIDRYDFPPHHFLWFSRDVLEAMLSRAGFMDAVVSVELFGFRMDELRNRLGRPVKAFVARGVRGRSQREPRVPGASSASPLRGSRAQVLDAIKTVSRLAAAPAKIAEAAGERVTGRGASLYFQARKPGLASISH